MMIKKSISGTQLTRFIVGGFYPCVSFGGRSGIGGSDCKG